MYAEAFVSNNNENVKVLGNGEFAYARFTLERQLTGSDGVPVLDKKGNKKPDPDLRDYEHIFLSNEYLNLDVESREDYVYELGERHLRDEVNRFIPDAWIDHEKTKIGYEIPFARNFYRYKHPRELNEISQEIENYEKEIQDAVRNLFK
jgi:type I restriction enzyme M protein